MLEMLIAAGLIWLGFKLMEGSKESGKTQVGHQYIENQYNFYCNPKYSRDVQRLLKDEGVYDDDVKMLSSGIVCESDVDDSKSGFKDGFVGVSLNKIRDHVSSKVNACVEKVDAYVDCLDKVPKSVEGESVKNGMFDKELFDMSNTATGPLPKS